MESTSATVPQSARVPAFLGNFVTHLRLPFQLALAPFFCLGALDADVTPDGRTALGFVAVHVGLYGGATVFNGFYDRDRGPIGMLKRPRPVTKGMHDAALLVQIASVAFLSAIDLRAGLIGLAMLALGILYSHPSTRFKGRVVAGLATVAFGQGALGVLLGRAVASGAQMETSTWWLAGAGALVALGLYPLTQVYQIDEDAARGDRTLPVRFGWRATFVFSGLVATVGLAALLAVLDERIDLGPWPVVAGGAAVAFAAYLVLWARRFERLDTYGNHDRAMALTAGVALPLAVLLLIALFGWPGAAHGEAALEVVDVTFEFKDPKTDEVLLSGAERVTRDGGMLVKHTEYKSLDGKSVQTEDCRYDAETLLLETYAFADLGTGEKAELKVKDGVASAVYRADKDADETSGEFAWTAASLSGKAIPELVHRHWSEIEKGQQVDFDLYIPFRMETLGFRAVADPDASDATRTVVRVEPRNWLIRQFAPSIAFTYTRDANGGAPRLSQYDGPSMVDIRGEKNRRVRILFR